MLCAENEKKGKESFEQQQAEDGRDLAEQREMSLRLGTKEKEEMRWELNGGQ
jgi:hypothetical protein